MIDDAAYERLEALGEARELAGEPDAADDEYWKDVLIASMPKNLFDEISDNLFMGGGPWGNPLHLPGAFVAVLDIVPSNPYIYWDDTEVRTVLMDDSWHQPLGGVDELAQWVNEKRKLGNVLVKCAAGLNRSGVTVARALMLGPEQLTGKEAIALIREKRDKMALCNQMFEEWILSLGREARCTCGATQPSSQKLAFFEFRGEGSRSAVEQCKHCGHYECAHQPEYMETLVHGRDGKRRPTVVESGRCTGFEPRGDWGYDTYYCGHAGWD